MAAGRLTRAYKNVHGSRYSVGSNKYDIQNPQCEAVNRQYIYNPFPDAPLGIASDTNTTSHRSRWFQRFGTIPGSLDIYYAISAR